MPPTATLLGNSASQLPSPGFNAGARPYRSHKVRACDLCRKRKSRCTVDIPGQSCLLCRVQGAVCHYQEEPGNDPPIANATDPIPAEKWPQEQGPEDISPGQKRKRASDDISLPNPERPKENAPGNLRRATSVGEHRSNQFRRLGVEDPQNESVFIVGPVVADDAQVIEKHLPPERTSKSVEPKSHPYNVYSSDPRKPILYTTVSRRRQGMRAGIPPGENQKEILEQILGPFKDDLVRLFVLFFSMPSISMDFADGL